MRVSLFVRLVVACLQATLSRTAAIARLLGEPSVAGQAAEVGKDHGVIGVIEAIVP